MTKYLWLPPTADSWENHLLNGFDVTGISWCGHKIKADKYLRDTAVRTLPRILLTSSRRGVLTNVSPPSCSDSSVLFIEIWPLISPKLRHIVNMAPSPPATLRFHRKIGHCQIEPQILAVSHIQFCSFVFLTLHVFYFLFFCFLTFF